MAKAKHSIAVDDFLAYVTKGTVPWSPGFWPSSPPSPNLWLRYKVLAMIWMQITFPPGMALRAIHDELRDFLTDLLDNHLYKKEDFSPTYTPCWKANMHFLACTPWVPEDIRYLAREWLDRSTPSRRCVRRPIVAPPLARTRATGYG
jgi:hypothetical protein